MSSISLSKLLRLAAASQRRKPSGREIDATRKASTGVQDRSAKASDPISPTLFWKIIMALAMASFACNAIGMTVFGSDWLTAYWDALADWCAGGYC